MLSSGIPSVAGNQQIGCLTIKVVSVGVEASRFLQRGMKPKFTVSSESRPSKFQSTWYNLYMPIPQCIIYNIFVLLYLQAQVPSVDV